MGAAENRKPEEWGEAFSQQRETYIRYTQALEALFMQLLEREGIPYVQIEARTKDVPNFVSKLRRKSYSDPLREVTDLSGIRLVLYYLDDVERVDELVADQFSLDRENSVDKGALMDPDRFGYLSVHYVIKPSTLRKELPEWNGFADLCAEVQVRTVLQHAWGAISRKLAYASVREAPRDLQRSLNRLSALLELADEEFVDIREARSEIEQQYDREVERGNLDLAVDESSLEVYLRESGIADWIARMAKEEGSPPYENDDEEEKEETRDLLTTLDRLGIQRIAELDDRLATLRKEMPRFIGLVNKGFRNSDGEPMPSLPKNWLCLALLWSSRAPAEDFEAIRYVDPLIELITGTYPSNSE